MKQQCSAAVFAMLICHWVSPIQTGHAQVSYNVQFLHDGLNVRGTFTAPSDVGRFPTIIIAPGSGPGDRDLTLTLADSTAECLYPELHNETLRPYKQLAEALTDAGYAVLRYDKLEYTYLPALLNPITFHKLWLPVESAIAYVKTRQDVDTTCITLLGHSEGSSLIPFIALGRTDIQALISVAGPRTPFDSILAYQIVNIATICNDDTLAAQNTAGQILNYFHLVRVNEGNGLPPFEVPAKVWYDYLVATEAVSENYNLNNLPTLFIGFGLDINVPLSELERFQNEVSITDDFWALPDIIHYMTPFDDPHVSMALTDTIIYWLSQQECGTSAVSDETSGRELFSVFPNPFVDDIQIVFAQPPGSKVVFTITDITGVVVFRMEEYLNEDVRTLHLPFLPKGMFILEVEVGGRQAVEKIYKF